MQVQLYSAPSIQHASQSLSSLHSYMFIEEVRDFWRDYLHYVRETALLSSGSLYGKSDNNCKGHL